MQPVAISVDTPAESHDLVSKAGYTFPLLSDRGAAIIRRYGIVHPKAGVNGADIARPAEFLVDRNGIVRWRNLTGDFRVRARPDDIIAAARALQ